MPPEAPTIRMRAPPSDLTAVTEALPRLHFGCLAPATNWTADARSEPTHDCEEFCRRRAVGGIGGKVQECDLTVRVDDDIGAELQGVVATRHADALAGKNRTQAGSRDAGAQQPEWLWATGAESGVERSLRIGNDEGVSEGDLDPPGSSPVGALRCDDDQAAACILDLRNGLHDTAKV